MGMSFKPLIEGKDVIIGNGVEFGNNVLILGPCTIGDRVIIHHNCILGQRPYATAGMKRHSQVDEPLIIGMNTIVGSQTILYTGTAIGNDVLIADLVSVREKCSIGDKCVIGSGVTINLNTRIGNNVKIMNQTHITADSVVEDNVFISLMVGSSNDNKMGRSEYVMGGVHIKEGASIGAGVLFLPNLTIGKKSVVGAGAVVTKDVPDGKLVVGVPAKIVGNTPNDLSSD
jgi:acetyltransferase-like isoleucine patch superfamily enzyme